MKIPSIDKMWNFDWPSMLFLLLMILVYLYATRFRLQQRSVYFFAGIMLSVICIASPLHYLGEHYLFSAHMLSHVLLLLVAAPALVAGLPGQNRFEKYLVKLSGYVYHKPFAGWIAGVGIMWFWHIPVVFNQLVPGTAPAMQMHQGHSLHLIMSVHFVSLIIAGMLFFWPFLNPYKKYRITSLAAVLYLATACVFCSLLGLFIAFAPADLYTGYIMHRDTGLLATIRHRWGISAADDQQMGGLIMWVPCCFIYLSACMVLLVKWFNESEPVPADKKPVLKQL